MLCHRERLLVYKGLAMLSKVPLPSHRLDQAPELNHYHLKTQTEQMPVLSCKKNHPWDGTETELERYDTE